MLIRRFVVICLLGLFAAGCTTVDKQTTQSIASTKAAEKAVAEVKEPEELAQAEQEIEPEVLAFVASEPVAPQVQDDYLPHATEQTHALIKTYAKAYDVPERLVRRVVRRESHGNPQARNGPYWGLMQISYPTAQSMGYQGKPEGLLDAETNLKYAVKYLAGAYLVAGGDETQAVRLYARGFYYDAKAKGLLERTGLRPGPTSIMTAFADE